MSKPTTGNGEAHPVEARPSATQSFLNQPDNQFTTLRYKTSPGLSFIVRHTADGDDGDYLEINFITRPIPPMPERILNDETCEWLIDHYGVDIEMRMLAHIKHRLRTTLQHAMLMETLELARIP